MTAIVVGVFAIVDPAGAATTCDSVFTSARTLDTPTAAARQLIAEFDSPAFSPLRPGRPLAAAQVFDASREPRWPWPFTKTYPSDKLLVLADANYWRYGLRRRTNGALAMAGFEWLGEKLDFLGLGIAHVMAFDHPHSINRQWGLVPGSSPFAFVAGYARPDSEAFARLLSFGLVPVHLTPVGLLDDLGNHGIALLLWSMEDPDSWEGFKLLLRQRFANADNPALDKDARGKALDAAVALASYVHDRTGDMYVRRRDLRFNVFATIRQQTASAKP
jgi:hypothetical protein